jgi:hypothetical protein
MCGFKEEQEREELWKFGVKYLLYGFLQDKQTAGEGKSYFRGQLLFFLRK